MTPRGRRVTVKLLAVTEKSDYWRWVQEELFEAIAHAPDTTHAGVMMLLAGDAEARAYLAALSGRDARAWRAIQAAARRLATLPYGAPWPRRKERR